MRACALCLHVLTASDSQKTRVQIWLYEQLDARMEGTIIVRCGISRLASLDWATDR